VKSRLEPIAEGIKVPDKLPGGESFAHLGRAAMTALARSMPDAQSAVLFCLAWHATINLRMQHGPLTGQLVARVSARELRKITLCPIRTVRHALRRLRDNHLIHNEESRRGRTAIYRLTLGNSRVRKAPGFRSSGFVAEHSFAGV
jgi:DNA-binding transcriptional ArsR family regulator